MSATAPSRCMRIEHPACLRLALEARHDDASCPFLEPKISVIMLHCRRSACRVAASQYSRRGGNTLLGNLAAPPNPVLCSKHKSSGQCNQYPLARRQQTGRSLWLSSTMRARASTAGRTMSGCMSGPSGTPPGFGQTSPVSFTGKRRCALCTHACTIRPA